MCGRYAVTLPPEAIRAFFGYAEQPNFPPRHNIAPTQPIAIVRRDLDAPDPQARRFRLVRWGFVPSFIKEFASFRPFVNARGEDITERASFRNAFKRRRCLVIADAFYEWQKRERGPSQPFLVRQAGGTPFGLAGVTETWMGADGSELDTACIITMASAGPLAKVHARMPVIVPPEAFEVWLDADERVAGEAERLLHGSPVERLEVVPIGPAVNKVSNDDPSIQLPVDVALPDGSRPASPAAPLQGSLF